MTRSNPTGTETLTSTQRQAFTREEQLVLTLVRKLGLRNSSLPGDSPCKSPRPLPEFLGQRPHSGLPAAWSPPSHPSGKWSQCRGGSTNQPRGKSPGLKACLNYQPLWSRGFCGDEVSLSPGLGWGGLILPQQSSWLRARPHVPPQHPRAIPQQPLPLSQHQPFSYTCYAH